MAASTGSEATDDQTNERQLQIFKGRSFAEKLRENQRDSSDQSLTSLVVREPSRAPLEHCLMFYSLAQSTVNEADFRVVGQLK